MVQGSVHKIACGKHSDCVYFSSSLQNDIRCYSLEENRATSFHCRHKSPVTIICLSARSIYMLSASNDPLTVYLEDLTGNKMPIQLIPSASSSLVTLATFHPEQEAIFLLAYEDGTVSIHSAIQLLVSKTRFSTSQLYFVEQLHAKPTYDERGPSCKSIAAAAFAPGYTFRTISVGTDGVLIHYDFELSLQPSVPWNVGGVCTSLSILSYPATTVTPKVQSVRREPGNKRLIAVGRQSGSVGIYDIKGVLRHEHNFDDLGPICDVQWIPSLDIKEKTFESFDLLKHCFPDQNKSGLNLNMMYSKVKEQPKTARKSGTELEEPSKCGKLTSGSEVLSMRSSRHAKVTCSRIANDTEKTSGYRYKDLHTCYGDPHIEPPMPDMPADEDSAISFDKTLDRYDGSIENAKSISRLMDLPAKTFHKRCGGFLGHEETTLRHSVPQNGRVQSHTHSLVPSTLKSKPYSDLSLQKRSSNIPKTTRSFSNWRQRNRSVKTCGSKLPAHRLLQSTILEEKQPSIKCNVALQGKSTYFTHERPLSVSFDHCYQSEIVSNNGNNKCVERRKPDAGTNSCFPPMPKSLPNGTLFKPLPSMPQASLDYHLKVDISTHARPKASDATELQCALPASRLISCTPLRSQHCCQHSIDKAQCRIADNDSMIAQLMTLNIEIAKLRQQLIGAAGRVLNCD